MSLQTIVADHLRSNQVARVIYGAIIGLALVVALEHHPPPPAAVVATLVGTAIAVAFAELYSDLVGFETRRHHTAGRSDRSHFIVDAAAVSFGITFPAIFFILAALGAMDDDTAFTVAKWSGLGMIGLYGLVGARLAGRSWAMALAQALGVALVGALLIGLKALVH